MQTLPGAYMVVLGRQTGPSEAHTDQGEKGLWPTEKDV